MKKIIWTIALLVILGLIIWGTSGKNATAPTGNTNEPIKIGAVLGFTGSAATWADMSKKAIDLAVKEINSTGGINGRNLEIIYEDGQTNPAKDTSAFNKLISVDKVNVVFGDLWSFITNPLIPLAEQNKVTLISPTVMDVSVEKQSPYFFTVGHTIESQRDSVEKFFKVNKGIKTLSVLYWNDLWGNANKDLVIDVATKNGVKIVSTEGVNDFTAAYQTEITKIKALKPDAIYFNSALPDVVMRKIKDLGMVNTKILSPAPVVDAIEVNKTPVDYLKNVYFTNWVPTTTFVDKFRKEYGVYPIMEAQNSYDMVIATALALKKDGDFKQNLKNVKFTSAENYLIDFTESDSIRVNKGKTELYTYDGAYHRID